MKFAKITFWIAAIWGFLVLIPLFFIFNLIGRNDPPAITHPGFYYGFVTTALAWQFAFIVIARDPIRLRPMMIPSILEKFGYAACMVVLYGQNRIHRSDLLFPAADSLLAILFILAFVKAARAGTRS